MINVQVVSDTKAILPDIKRHTIRIDIISVKSVKNFLVIQATYNDIFEHFTSDRDLMNVKSVVNRLQHHPD